MSAHSVQSAERVDADEFQPSILHVVVLVVAVSNRDASCAEPSYEVVDPGKATCRAQKELL